MTLPPTIPLAKFRYELLPDGATHAIQQILNRSPELSHPILVAPRVQGVESRSGGNFRLSAFAPSRSRPSGIIKIPDGDFANKRASINWHPAFSSGAQSLPPRSRRGLMPVWLSSAAVSQQVSAVWLYGSPMAADARVVHVEAGPLRSVSGYCVGPPADGWSCGAKRIRGFRWMASLCARAQARPCAGERGSPCVPALEWPDVWESPGALVWDWPYVQELGRLDALALDPPGVQALA
jgi:hypothetical protein